MQTKQPLDISTAELRLLQQEDPTLSEIREAAANQIKQSKYFLHRMVSSTADGYHQVNK